MRYFDFELTCRDCGKSIASGAIQQGTKIVTSKISECSCC